MPTQDQITQRIQAYGIRFLLARFVDINGSPNDADSARGHRQSVWVVKHGI